MEDTVPIVLDCVVAHYIDLSENDTKYATKSKRQHTLRRSFNFVLI